MHIYIHILSPFKPTSHSHTLSHWLFSSIPFICTSTYDIESDIHIHTHIPLLTPRLLFDPLLKIYVYLVNDELKHRRTVQKWWSTNVMWCSDIMLPHVRPYSVMLSLVSIPVTERVRSVKLIISDHLSSVIICWSFLLISSHLQYWWSLLLSPYILVI